MPAPINPPPIIVTFLIALCMAMLEENPLAKSLEDNDIIQLTVATGMHKFLG